MTKHDVLDFGWFNLARTNSLKVIFRHRIGSVLVRKGTPVSVGQNHPTKTHPMTKKYDPHKTIHAELDAIIGIDRSLANGSTMYVYREHADGTLACAKPCKMCMAFLLEMNVKRVYYTTEEGYEQLNFK